LGTSTFWVLLRLLSMVVLTGALLFFSTTSTSSLRCLPGFLTATLTP
jgi:hypothetical protein